MSGERDLAVLLAALKPELHPDVYVFAAGPAPAGIAPFATIAEDEGPTVVVRRAEADAAGLRYDAELARITLRVHSSLEAVGMTAAFATRLAQHGISCNVIAGIHHDHVFVQADRGEDALALLARCG